MARPGWRGKRWYPYWVFVVEKVQCRDLPESCSNAQVNDITHIDFALAYEMNRREQNRMGSYISWVLGVAWDPREDCMIEGDDAQRLIDFGPISSIGISVSSLHAHKPRGDS